MNDLSNQGYGGAARAFHWLTAILIAVLYALGWYMADLDNADPSKFQLYQIHKSIGITVFVLAVLRLGWRLIHRAPPWPSHMAAWERLAAAGAHWALYALILLQPLLGVLQSNAANFPIVFWGGFELPALIPPNETLADILLNMHHLLANVLAGLVLLHIAAALRHHIQLKDNVLRNMMPSAGLAVGVIVLALALALPPFLLMREDGTTATAAATDGGAEKSALIPQQSVAVDEDDAEGELWTIEEESELGFIATQQGSPVEGSFGTFDAEIVFDPADLESSRIDVDIDVTSITTGHSDRDKTVKSASFFDVETWPTASFKSRNISEVGKGSYEADGTLTMRDVTKDVVLPFTLDIQEEAGVLHAEANGNLPIKRLDYGIGQGSWASTTSVADEVVITIDIKASKPMPGSQPSG